MHQQALELHYEASSLLERPKVLKPVDMTSLNVRVFSFNCKGDVFPAVDGLLLLSVQHTFTIMKPLAN